ncbi:putative OPA3-like protein CG13603 [Camellia lanceoleosa]|uniref:OPA3-like protein CG13603 n=1 Tax=Camellia lanceoleosa TaxID=1840588 RepID=A0ACC0GY16_9ERIC|nr:putative OPA3-like protein CG13603 [Camellia lanceoleosa]
MVELDVTKKKSMAVLPVMKLGTLAIRTISKPIAARLKTDAGLHPKFRQFIINLAQANHRFSTMVQRRIYGYSTGLEIRPLNEGRAIEAASNILGELFVFSVAGLALIYEVQRNSRAEARKEELHRQELEKRGFNERGGMFEAQTGRSGAPCQGKKFPRHA